MKFRLFVLQTVSNSCGEDEEIKLKLIDVVLDTDAPKAEFTADPTSGLEPLTVTFTDKSTGPPTSWLWEFGDGDSSEEQNPVHTYKIANEYTVRLTVSNKKGLDTHEKVNLITVETITEPVAEFTGNPTSGFAPLDVQFNNLSTGDPTSFAWKFGDGEIESTQLSGEVSVRFKDLSSSPDGEIIKREWNFGDGTKSEENDPEHTYVGEEGDTFTVSLTVQNTEGFDTVTKASLISIKTPIIPGFAKGKVTDKSTGNVIIGAVISIKSGSEEVANVETTDDGLYFIQVPPGDYDIKADKEGFDEFSVKIKVEASKTESIDIELTAGGEGPAGDVTSLIVDPDIASGSFRRLTAIVKALDNDGNPLSGVTINAKASGTYSRVNPPSRETINGQAIFKFKFSPQFQDGRITFSTSEGLTATINQEGNDTIEPTPIVTQTPVHTPVPTLTPIITAVPTPTATSTPVPTSTVTATPVHTPIPTLTPFITAVPTLTPAPTSIPTLETVLLAVKTAGNGIGTIVSSPSGISCGLDCSGVFDKDTVVTLTAIPDTDSTFSGWSGRCSGTGDCVITMDSNIPIDSDKAVTATFNLKTALLEIVKSENGSGFVSSAPAGIACGFESGCNESYDIGTIVTLTANPDNGSTFAGWSGCTVDDFFPMMCDVLIDGDKSVIVAFDLEPTPTSTPFLTPTPTPIPTPCKDEVSVTIESTNCTAERFDFGGIISVTVEVNGIASGPVGSNVFTLFGTAGGGFDCTASDNLTSTNLLCYQFINQP